MIKTLNILVLILLFLHLGFVALNMGIKYVLSGPIVLEMGFFGLLLILQTYLGKLKINRALIVVVIASAIVGYFFVTGAFRV